MIFKMYIRKSLFKPKYDFINSFDRNTKKKNQEAHLCVKIYFKLKAAAFYSLHTPKFCTIFKQVIQSSTHTHAHTHTL